MNTPKTPTSRICTHELRFLNLMDPGRTLAFPCDADGLVDLDALSERARCSYFFARTVVGRDYAFPTVRASSSFH